jgi:hypothetical protein
MYMTTLLLLKMNKEVSALDALKPIDCSFVLSFEYHALGACFRPYSDF